MYNNICTIIIVDAVLKIMDYQCCILFLSVLSENKKKSDLALSQIYTSNAKKNVIT